MSVRAGGLIALLLVLTAAAPPYPVVVPKRSEAVRKAREAEFRRRNAEHWTMVEVDDRGFVKHVVTDDPELVRFDIARLRDFLRANADLFGFDPAVVDRLPYDSSHRLLVDEFGGALLGEINVMLGASGRRPVLDITTAFWIDVTPKLTEDAVAQLVVGGRYRETIGYARPVPLDCHMGRGGACRMPVRHTRHRTVTLERGDLNAVSGLLGAGDAIRVVICVDASNLEDPPARPAWRGEGPATRSLAPIDRAPRLPLLVDAVTGRVVKARVHGCDDPAFAAVRDDL